MTNPPTPFEYAFAGVTILAEALRTNRRIYRRRSTYQFITRPNEVVEALLADDLLPPRPWSPVLIESTDETRSLGQAA